MQWSVINEGINAIIIDGFYTNEQLKEIHQELSWLNKPSIMMPPEKLSSAKVEETYQTSKRGIFLEEVFNNWRHSALISHLINNLNKEEVVTKLLEINPFYNFLYRCNKKTHLVSYYENSDYYKPHIDDALFTILNYFHSEPRKYSGGEIILKSSNSSKEATIDPMNNRVIIIPSYIVHSVNEINFSGISGEGRYCCAQFLNFVDERTTK